MSEFNFNIGIYRGAYITLTASGISFNQVAIASLNYAKYICLGFDKTNKSLAIKPIYEEDNKVPAYPFISDGKKINHVTITSPILRKEILNLIGNQSYRKGAKIVAEFDCDRNILIVDLNKIYI